MAHVFEMAPTGRSKCRGCGQAIAKDDQRFGERLPNAFGEGEMTLWFHPLCAAYKRPESVLQALAESPGSVTDPAALERAARFSASFRRLPRVDGAERAPGSQAKCRHCKEKIEKGAWRIRLVFNEEGRFMPGGFLHLDCRNDYFEGHDVLEPLLHFSPSLSDEDRAELARALGADPARAKR
jgi:poly(ADP-ribose) polymerase-like protein